jgi:4-carboxymuconolactone decarboxylase
MKRGFLAAGFSLGMLLSTAAAAQERWGAIPSEQMTEAQKKAVAEFTKVRKNGPFGFWWGYLRMPEVLIPFLEIQTYVHEVLETPKSALGEKLTHFAILMVARQWTQQVIWSLHEANAIKSGLKPDIVSALAAGRRPANMAEDEELLYDFCIELQRNQSISDPTYAKMLARFGEKGIAEATLLQGEYTIMSMFMNVARTPLLDPKAKPPLNMFPR